MRKIYPSTFNKFVIFILYGLLSVAVITLAQTTQPTGDGMPSDKTCAPTLSPKGLLTIGYFQLDANTIKTIKGEYYDFINVIAYPKNPDNIWNDIHPKDPNPLLNDLVGAKNSTKILLSVRNYDLHDWPIDKAGYNGVRDDIVKTINTYNLDGVDIEYPGMRGLYCWGKTSNGAPASNDNLPLKLYDQSSDDLFLSFIKDLRDKIKGKIMLTVGNDLIKGLNNVNIGYIDYLNIETYRYSFYDNFNNPVDDNRFLSTRVRSNPNAPISAYDLAYNTWNAAGVDGKKIIMAIDLRNTFQVVNNESINTTQTVETDRIIYNIPAGSLTQIRFCPDNDNLNNNPDLNDRLIVYSFPWNIITDQITNTNNLCYEFADSWISRFDSDSLTSWLYKNDTFLVAADPGNPNYDYISYEGLFSLDRKLSHVTSKSLGGISVSDITYDNDKYSLVAYLQEIRKPSSGVDGSNPISTGSNPSETSSSSESPTNPSQNKDDSEKDKEKRKIIGGVVGSIVGVAFIAGAGFLWYRNKQKQQNLYDNKNFNYPHITDQGNPGMVPEGSPRTVPTTTVIPIASGYVTAMFDFEGKEENDLSFKKGDKIEVLERGDGPNDWWVGRVNGTVGEFPGNYVRE